METKKSEEGFVITQTPGEPIPKVVLVPRKLPASSPSLFHVNEEHLDRALQTEDEYRWCHMRFGNSSIHLSSSDLDIYTGL